MPVIEALAAQPMRAAGSETHWRAVAVELLPTSPDRIADEVSSVSLNDLLKYGARDKIEKLRRISLVASKQFLLDRQLRKM